MGSDVPFRLRPYPRAGARLDDAAGDTTTLIDRGYRPPPQTDPDLAAFIETLRTMPVNAAARKSTPAAPEPRPAGTSTVPSIPATLQVPGRSHIHATPVHHRAPENAIHETLAHGQDTDDAPAEAAVDETDSDTGEYVHEQVEGEHYHIDTKGRRVFEWVAAEGARFIAVDEDNNPLTDADGHFIFVTGSGVAVADRAGVRGGLGKVANLVKSGGASTTKLEDDNPIAYDENGVRIEHFPVPKPGKGAAVITNRIWGGRRLLFLSSAAIIMLVFGLLFGLLWGRSAVPAQGAISGNEAQSYRLSQFPVAAMSAFGQQYLQTCFTHGDANQVKQRAALLKQMSTGGASGGCGWTSGGQVQQPDMIAFTGRLKSIPGTFDHGAAAYLYYSVSTQAGKYLTVGVPVWVNSLSDPNDMSVVGDLGITAGTRTQKPNAYTPLGSEDTIVANDLRGNLIQPFLQAWAASDAKQIALTVTSDAQPDALQGLGGALTHPEVSQVKAYTTQHDPSASGGTVDYVNGDTLTVLATVTWNLPSSSSTQTTGYRILVKRVGGKWLVVDIGPGAVTDRAADASDGGGGIAGLSDSGDSSGGTAASTDPSSSSTQPSP